MKNLLFLFALVLFSTHTYSQNFAWARSMGGLGPDEVNDIAVDAAGNVYSIGSYSDTADFDPGIGVFEVFTPTGDLGIFIQKLDANGDLIWVKGIAGSGLPYSSPITEKNSIAIDDDQNVYLTGHFTGTVDFDPGPGVVSLSSAFYSSAFILKLDPDGDLVWVRQLEGTNDRFIYSIKTDDTGNVYFTGEFKGSLDVDLGTGTDDRPSTGDLDCFLIKVDSDANLLWAHTFGATGVDKGNSLLVNSSGVYLFGSFSATCDFDPGPGNQMLNYANGRSFLLKLNPSGTFSWAKNVAMEFIRGPYGNSMEFDVSGNIYIGGSYTGTVDFDPGPGSDIHTSVAGHDPAIIKMDGVGNYIWARTVESLGMNYGWSFSFTVDRSDGVYLVGLFGGASDFDPGPGTYTLTPTGNYVMGYHVKLDTAGNFVWAHQFEGTYNYSLAITSDAIGNIYSGGGFYQNTIDFDRSSAVFNLTPVDHHDAYIFKLSSPLSTPQITKAVTPILIYPNPTTKTINISSQENIEKILVTDILGKKVYEAAPGNKSTSIDIGTPGVYFITTFSANTTRTQKLIVSQ